MIDEKTCLLWAEMDQYKRKKRKVFDDVKSMIAISQNPYIAFSCGKDSSVLADIVLQINPKIKMRFISSGETRIVHNVDDIMDYFRDKYSADIEEINFDRVFSEKWKNASFDEQRKAGRRDIQNVDNSKYDGVFMGLRRQESRARQISLICCKTDGLPNGMYKYSNKEFFRMCPLERWKTEDIGAYISENGIPTLKWYKQFGFEGRTTARITGDAVRQNTLFFLKLNNPAGYQKIVERFPELKV